MTTTNPSTAIEATNGNVAPALACHLEGDTVHMNIAVNVNVNIVTLLLRTLRTTACLEDIWVFPVTVVFTVLLGMAVICKFSVALIYCIVYISSNTVKFLIQKGRGGKVSADDPVDL
eukprot:scaffold10550_cov271-Chaetoceros_neogracile.AAC.44